MSEAQDHNAAMKAALAKQLANMPTMPSATETQESSGKLAPTEAKQPEPVQPVQPVQPIFVVNESEEVAIADITVRHGERTLQLRVDGTDAKHVEELKTEKEDGIVHQPIKLWRLPDGELVLVDGHHQLEAAIELGEETILAVITDGDEDEAFMAAVKADSANVKLRSNKDKANAVRRLLLHPTLGSQWHNASARKFAREIGIVTAPTFSRIRKELADQGLIPESGDEVMVERNGKEVPMKTSNIGAKPKADSGLLDRDLTETSGKRDATAIIDSLDNFFESQEADSDQRAEALVHMVKGDAAGQAILEAAGIDAGEPDLGKALAAMSSAQKGDWAEYKEIRLTVEMFDVIAGIIEGSGNDEAIQAWTSG